MPPDHRQFNITENVKHENLKFTFYQTERVEDRGDWRIQKVTESVVTGFPICVAGTGITHDDGVESYYLPAESMTALAIKMDSSMLFKIRITVGGQNIAVPDPETDHEASGTPRQDYYVSPAQECIDGITIREGLVRQFLVLNPGTRYSIEHQRTGRDDIRGFRIEVFECSRIRSLPVNDPVSQEPFGFYINIKCEDGEMLQVDTITKDMTADEVICLVAKHKGIESWFFELFYQDRWLDRYDTLGSSEVESGGLLSLVMASASSGMPLCAEWEIPDERQMTIAAGGLILQSIAKDPIPGRWYSKPLATLDVAVVGLTDFESITGHKPSLPSDKLRKAYKADSSRIYNPIPNTNDPVKSLAEMHSQEPNEALYGEFQQKMMWEEMGVALGIVCCDSPPVLFGSDVEERGATLDKWDKASRLRLPLYTKSRPKVGKVQPARKRFTRALKNIFDRLGT